MIYNIIMCLYIPGRRGWFSKVDPEILKITKSSKEEALALYTTHANWSVPGSDGSFIFHAHNAAPVERTDLEEKRKNAYRGLLRLDLDPKSKTDWAIFRKMMEDAQIMQKGDISNSID